jgi:hypothetical protein
VSYPGRSACCSYEGTGPRRTERGETRAYRQAEVSRGQSRGAAGAPKARTVGRRAYWRWDRSNAPGKQLELPFAEQGGEASVGASGQSTPVSDDGLMERVVERRNLVAALARVKRNRGSPGVDGMTVEELPGYLREHWPERRAALIAGTYQPSPVRRVEIPKPGGGVRQLGMPTVCA